MFRNALGPLVFALTFLVAFPARAQETIHPEEAAQDPDFAVQGEYTGEGNWPGADKTRIGAQVIGLGDGQFRAELFRGGLPGDGWKRGDDQLTLGGKRDGDVTALAGNELSASIEGGKLTLTGADGKALVEMERTERKSPTLGEKPPGGAVVLFDGTTADRFDGGVLTDMGTLQAGTTAKEQYKIARLHLEFRLSWKPTARGQGRSNSGVYIGGIPEIQVLDSFGLEGKKNECGAFYGRREPDVNMCLPPLVWQTYDVEFTEPKPGDDGKPQGNILVTVRHNGVPVHADYNTGKKQLGPQRLHLQSHGNHVQYRNIWLVERK